MQILSLRFNGDFPDGSGLAGTRSPFWILLKLRMMEAVVTTGTVITKLNSNQTCSQDRQCQDQDQDQDRSVRDQDRKWQYETKCTDHAKITFIKNFKDID